jgi:FkbM family methyltransferase
LTVAAVIRRFVYGVLTRAPVGVVGRARRNALLAPILEGVQAVIGAPLYGHAVPVARGAGAGLLLVAERRSLAWLSGRVEPEVQEVLVEHLPPGATFVDVGASVGFFSLLAGRLVGPEGRVVAFEPQPAAVASIRRNVRLNSFDMVEVLEAIVSSRTAQAALVGIGKATAHVARGGDRHGLTVRATTLDDHFGGRLSPPVVVKIDVEGHERDVLTGMRRLLQRSSPVLLVETHGTTDAVRADLARHGYETTFLGARHLLCAPAEGP